MLLVRENLGKSEAWAKRSHSNGKPLETAGVCLKVGWAKASRNYQGGANSEPGWWRLIVLASSSVALWEEGLSKEQWPLPALLSRRKLSQALALMPDSSVLSICLWWLNLLPPYWILEGVSLCTGPLRGTARESSSSVFHSLNFHWFWVPNGNKSPARSCGDLSFWHWNPGLGDLVWGWDPLLLRYPAQFLSATRGCGTSSIPRLCCFYQSWCNLFFSPVFVELHSAQFLMVLNDFWWLFYRLVVILMWL